ncbi:uncharacterized protein UTRI_10059 [Ustilago trichophora]|uniref:CoA-transferase family III n=1 Tax=Ustilago trichophora TaxID=86804 RepID=A0A5C3DTI7_9BASI|nr:uncharacterized protein UTRI_10059 [Ustilago trichophora]
MASETRIYSSLDIIRQLWGQAQLPSAVLENTIARGNVMLPHDPAEVGQGVKSSFQLTAVAQGICAGISLAHRLCAVVEEMEGGEEVDKMVLDRVVVDARHALAEYKGWTRVHLGQEQDLQEMLKTSIPSDSDMARSILDIPPTAVSDWDPLAGLYRTLPNPNRSIPGMVRIHTNFPHHKLGILQLLKLVPTKVKWNDEGIQEIFARFTKDDVQREVANWDAFELEEKAQGRGLCVTAYRSAEEWEASAMGKAVKSWMNETGGSAFRISRIANVTTAAPQKTSSSTSRKARRLRVIDMSRVIAGPISTRTLAALGSDVLLLSSPLLPNLPLRELDTARGKRTAHLTLPRSPSPHLPAEMIELIQGADVFSQAYRPQALSQRGLSAESIQALRPGIIYAELCAFGFTGPWAGRRAYDSLTQTACGMNHLESINYNNFTERSGEGREVAPKALPVQALDYAAGSLMCFATLACKIRASLERVSSGDKKGGEEGERGWKVQVSLASTAEWIKSLGQVHDEQAWELPPKDVIPEDAEVLADMVSGYKVRGLKGSASLHDEEERVVRVLAIRHASLRASDTQGGEDRRWGVPAHLGVDELRW